VTTDDVCGRSPSIPQPLKEQLDLSGRLVMPVGPSQNEQRLVRVTRRDATHFEV
jgi:protein-L-isoaspartate(D-aspartate) O-methyltransferase